MPSMPMGHMAIGITQLPENQKRLRNASRKQLRNFTYEELAQRDKCNLDIFWLKDESLEDSASLPEPDIIIVDIIEDLRTALEQLEEIAGDVSVAD